MSNTTYASGSIPSQAPVPTAPPQTPKKSKGGFFSWFGGKKESSSAQPTPPVVSPTNSYPMNTSGSYPAVNYPTNTDIPSPNSGYPNHVPTSYPIGSHSANAAVTPSRTGKVSLEKKLQSGAPSLVSLAKPLQLEIEKRHLQDCVARVALVLDISGSMSGRYANGTVQQIVNKTLPLAVQFDDDGELDFWYYGSRPKRMPSVSMKNYTEAVPKNWRDLMSSLGYGNTEPLVMKEVVKEYTGSRLPAYVIFITDGGVGSASEIKNVLTNASRQPIFWQFVGVGGSSYGVLEQLDNMSGRYVDNANFFALDDFKKVSNEELYSRLLNEFPSWLNEVKRLGMI